MILTEPIFANLFTLLAATEMLDADGDPTGTAAFATTGRKLPPQANVGASTQPALYMLEGDEQEDPDSTMGLERIEMTAAAVVFFRSDGQAVPSTLLNNLRDAVFFQMTQRTLQGVSIIPLAPGQLQSLGGVCFHARLKGRVLKNEGLQNGQGAIVFAISILFGD